MDLVIRNALIGSTIVTHPLKVITKESTRCREFGNILSYFCIFSRKYKFLKFKNFLLKQVALWWLGFLNAGFVSR